MSDHEARIVLILVLFLGMLLGAIFTLLFAPWVGGSFGMTNQEREEFHRGGGL